MPQGRGRGRGQGFITSFHPTQSLINSLDLDPFLHSPGYYKYFNDVLFIIFFLSFLNTRYYFVIFFFGATSIHEPSADVGHSTNGYQSTNTIDYTYI